MKNEKKQPDKNVVVKSNEANASKASEQSVATDHRNGWDGSMVIKVDIFGNKWVTT